MYDGEPGAGPRGVYTVVENLMRQSAPPRPRTLGDQRVSSYMVVTHQRRPFGGQLTGWANHLHDRRRSCGRAYAGEWHSDNPYPDSFLVSGAHQVQIIAPVLQFVLLHVILEQDVKANKQDDSNTQHEDQNHIRWKAASSTVIKKRRTHCEGKQPASVCSTGGDQVLVLIGQVPHPLT
jgi:hypothetical protein